MLTASNNRTTAGIVAPYVMLYDTLMREYFWDDSGSKPCTELEMQTLRESLHYMKRTWYTTLRRLQDVPEDSEIWTQFKGHVLWLWRTHGRSFGLDEAIERERREHGGTEEPVERSMIDPPRLPCNWAQCLCAEHQAPHYMRICKGCWDVFYCSTACQTKCVLHLCDGSYF